MSDIKIFACVVAICVHTVRSARVPAPHYRSQHIQANTTRGFLRSVLLTIGVMMPETCWDKTNCE